MARMAFAFPRIRGRLDRIGLALSCLCAVHCVLGIVIVAGLGLGGAFLLDPAIHRVGLLLATIVAAGKGRDRLHVFAATRDGARQQRD